MPQISDLRHPMIFLLREVFVEGFLQKEPEGRAQREEIEWEEDAPTESDRYGGDLGRTLGFPVQAGHAHHPQRSVPCWTTFPLGVNSSHKKHDRLLPQNRQAN